MPLTDEQIERYSRQLVLPEVGPGGQERLGAACVAVVGEGVAAERVVAYLAAAGVGHLAVPPALQSACDPAQPDLELTVLETDDTPVDVAIIAARDIAAAVADVERWRDRAGATLWMAAGLVGGVPPCPRCAAAALAPILASGAVGDALLGTIAATEAIKALLAIGTPLAGRVLRYDADAASITDATALPSCSACIRTADP